MRVGAIKRIEAVELKPTEKVFDFASLITRPKEAIYVGLVGGCDPASVAVRQAQSFLRFDRRPSYFSHVFLFAGRGDALLECRLVGADPSRPENGGIWRDRARRYADPKDYPNKAVIEFGFTPAPNGLTAEERVSKVLKAARDPRLVRERYDLWEMVAGWQQYLFEPVRTPNPLAERLPHPGAAYVRWALGMAGIEAAPGALDEFDAPEHFWAAANYWYRQYADKSVGVKLTLVRQIADKACTVRLP